MAGRVFSKSGHAAIPMINIDFAHPETGDLSLRLLADDPSPLTPVSSLDTPVRRRSPGASNATEEESIELGQLRSNGNATSQKSSKTVQRNIYLSSPALMTGAFLAGVSFAIGHHLYYQSLNGQAVGDSNRQQWAIRFGTAFAFLVKNCLAASAGIACVQWLWKTLRRNFIAIEGIDAAFSARGSLLSFLNWEMLSKIKIGTFMALVIWCVPLAALITPATRSVKVAYQDVTTSEKVATLNISTLLEYASFGDVENLENIERFAEINQLSPDAFSIKGSSMRLARIISASAASGEILSIMRPFSRPNMTYRIEPHIPVIRCENSSLAVARNTTTAAVFSFNEGEFISGPSNFSALDMGRLEYDGDALMKIGYFAMIPLDDQGMTRSWGGPYNVSTFDQPNLNQLWVVIADQGNNNATIPRFLTCGLWNASLSLNISFLDNIQSVRPEKFTYINEVPPRIDWFGIGSKDENPTNIADMVYTAYFWGFCEQLTGLVVSQFEPPAWQPYIEANIKNTVLTGAVEFVAMMKNFSHGLSEASPPLNKSLSALIEELSLNVSLNMLSDSYLSTLIPADVAYSEVQKEYSYGYHNLVLAYGLAIFFTLISVLLGWSAYLSNGMSYDFTVSSIIGTSQNPDLAHLFRRQSETPGAQPLDPQIAKTKLRFGTVVPLRSQMVAGEPVRHTAFGLEGTVSQIEKS